jgi:hypothetical protein
LVPFVGYQIVDGSATDAQITGVLEEDVRSRGGELGRILLRQEWDYFPHLSTNALRDGFYYRVAALRGRGHAFYVGGALAFETIEDAARQAEALIRMHFPPAFLP